MSFISAHLSTNAKASQQTLKSSTLCIPGSILVHFFWLWQWSSSLQNLPALISNPPSVTPGQSRGASEPPARMDTSRSRPGAQRGASSGSSEETDSETDSKSSASSGLSNWCCMLHKQQHWKGLRWFLTLRLFLPSAENTLLLGWLFSAGGKRFVLACMIMEVHHLTSATGSHSHVHMLIKSTTTTY